MKAIKRIIKAYRGEAPDFSVPGWSKSRGYDLFTPKDVEEEVPLILVLHGYTHDGRKMRSLTSPDGSPDHPRVFDRMANQRGFAVAYPYGSKIGFLPGRCWAAGGGVSGFAPVGDPAVRLKVDDVAFIRDLLRHLGAEARIDQDRVFLLGISNGGAMVQRLATEMPECWKGVVTVAGCNQYCAALNTRPGQAVPRLHIHGTSDKVWPYEGGKVKAVGVMESVEKSVAGWVQANQAQLAEETPLHSAAAEDPTSVSLRRYQGVAPVEHYIVKNGGHAWPDGDEFMSPRLMGLVCRHFSANQVALDFFERC